MVTQKEVSHTHEKPKHARARANRPACASVRLKPDPNAIATNAIQHAARGEAAAAAAAAARPRAARLPAAHAEHVGRREGLLVEGARRRQRLRGGRPSVGPPWSGRSGRGSSVEPPRADGRAARQAHLRQVEDASCARGRAQSRRGGAREALRWRDPRPAQAKANGGTRAVSEGRAAGGRTHQRRSPPDHRRSGCAGRSSRAPTNRSSSTCSASLRSALPSAWCKVEQRTRREFGELSMSFAHVMWYMIKDGYARERQGSRVAQDAPCAHEQSSEALAPPTAAAARAQAVWGSEFSSRYVKRSSQPDRERDVFFHLRI